MASEFPEAIRQIATRVAKLVSERAALPNFQAAIGRWADLLLADMATDDVWYLRRRSHFQELALMPEDHPMRMGDSQPRADHVYERDHVLAMGLGSYISGWVPTELSRSNRPEPPPALGKDLSLDEKYVQLAVLHDCVLADAPTKINPWENFEPEDHVERLRKYAYELQLVPELLQARFEGRSGDLAGFLEDIEADLRDGPKETLSPKAVAIPANKPMAEIAACLDHVPPEDAETEEVESWLFNSRSGVAVRLRRILEDGAARELLTEAAGRSWRQCVDTEGEPQELWHDLRESFVRMEAEEDRASLMVGPFPDDKPVGLLPTALLDGTRTVRALAAESRSYCDAPLVTPSDLICPYPQLSLPYYTAARQWQDTPKAMRVFCNVQQVPIGDFISASIILRLRLMTELRGVLRSEWTGCVDIDNEYASFVERANNVHRELWATQDAEERSAMMSLLQVYLAGGKPEGIAGPMGYEADWAVLAADVPKTLDGSQDCPLEIYDQMEGLRLPPTYGARYGRLQYSVQEALKDSPGDVAQIVKGGLERLQVSLAAAEVHADTGPKGSDDEWDQEQDVGANVFRKKGNVWTLRFEGKETLLGDLKGLRYLAYLLSCPDKDVHVKELHAVVDPPTDDDRSAEFGRLSQEQLCEMAMGVTNLGDQQALVDRLGRENLTKAVEELRDNIPDDPAGAAEANDTIEHIERILKGTKGLSGREKAFTDPVEKKRKAVTNCIRYSLKKIKKKHGPLSGHLQRSLKRGIICCYSPGCDMSWTL